MIIKMVFYEQAMRVPLVVRPPGGGAARRTAQPVQLMDLAATCRDIAGDGVEDHNGIVDPSYASVREELMETWVRPFLRQAPLRPHPDLVKRAMAAAPAQS